MIKEKLNIDEKDEKIASLLMEDPYMSQYEIAKIIGLSQPSIAVRINKLKQRGIIAFNVGINFSKTNFFVARVDFTAKNASDILKTLKECPYFINGYIISGKNNVSAMFIHHDLVKIENIISQHLRSNQSISEINTSLIVSSARDLIFSVDISGKNMSKACKMKECIDCHIGQDKTVK